MVRKLVLSTIFRRHYLFWQYVQYAAVIQRRIEGEGWGGCNSPFGKFSNLSGYPRLSLFHTKNNIMSYNTSPSPIYHFKKTVATPLLDSLIIQTHAGSIFGEDRHARNLLCLVPSIIENKALQLDDEVEGMLFWEKDNPFPKSLRNEALRWKTLWQSANGELPNNLLLALCACDEDDFPNMYRLLVIAGTLLITSAEAERSFSPMKWTKSCSRSSVPKERCSDLAVIATHYSERFDVEVDEICQQAFVKAGPRRLFQASLFD